MDNYDILDQNGNPVNIIVWDGVSEWKPPPGHTVVPHDPARWRPPVEEIDPASIVRTWTVNQVRDGLTLAEKVKWDNDADPLIITAKKELEIPKQLGAVTEILDMLVGANLISEASKKKILA